MAEPGPQDTPRLLQDFARRVPDDDTHARKVCTHCGYVAYENPKIVVGTVVAAGDRILLCKRAIEPRRGFWTIPAGYMEMGETVEQAATREAFEEACARVVLDGVLAIYTIVHLGQVQVMFRGAFAGPADFAAGDETEAAMLCAWDDIPWDELAFPTVTWALRAWHATRGVPLGAPAIHS